MEYDGVFISTIIGYLNGLDPENVCFFVSVTPFLTDLFPMFNFRRLMIGLVK